MYRSRFDKLPHRKIMEDFMEERSIPLDFDRFLIFSLCIINGSSRDLAQKHRFNLITHSNSFRTYVVLLLLELFSGFIIF